MPNAVTALDDVSFEVEEGDFVGIIGAMDNVKNSLEINTFISRPFPDERFSFVHIRVHNRTIYPQNSVDKTVTDISNNVTNYGRKRVKRMTD